MVYGDIRNSEINQFEDTTKPGSNDAFLFLVSLPYLPRAKVRF